MSDHNPPPGGHNFNAQFMNLNIGAQPFVPSPRAQPFVPMHPPPGFRTYSYNMQGGGGGGRYGPSHVPMGMHHQMHPGGGGNYRMPAQQHGMGTPYNPHPIPVSALEADYHSKASGGSSHSGPVPPLNMPSGHARQHQQQQHYPPHTHTLTPLHHHPPPPPSSSHLLAFPVDGSQELSTFNVATTNQSPSTEPTPSQDDAVDSWEDMADEENCTNSGLTMLELPCKASSSISPLREGEECGKNEEMQVSPSSQTKDEVDKDSQMELQAKLMAESMDVSTPSTVSSVEGSLNGSSGGSSRKNPSPNLSKSSKMDGASSKAGQLAQPPPKSKEDKENLNVIFIGHVDAGKSTIGGHIMYLTGQVDKRTLEKYEREAREKNRETWYLSWALDTNQEERDKGKTVEVGRASFETLKKRFTILDAPGHAGFVPNMIGGAAQADVGVLVISARKGEFETGFERKGQTREHAMLAKTAGVKHLVILVNKMDDPTVQWLEERYEECKMKLTPFLKKVGFNPKTDMFFMPVSGLTGANLKESATKECPWYSGPPFITYLDNLPPVIREDNGLFRMPIADKYKDMGTLVMGKLESGAVMKGSSLLLMPNRVPVEVLQIIRVEDEVAAAYSGDNVKLRLKGVEEEDISAGFVLCDPLSPCNMSQLFEAQIVILEHKSIICAGYNAVLHIHTVVEEVQIMELKALVDRKTGKRVARNPRFVKQDQIVIATLQTNGVICVENFKDFPQMARFTLRDEGKTIAIGKVLKVLSK